MAISANHPPISLGLGGDGDEIDAIRDVEQEFGVQLDYTGACEWLTVGHVFAALKESLPPERAESSDVWPRFVQAISAETGVDPSRVTVDTLLLGKATFDWSVAVILACTIGLALAAVRYW